MWWAIQLERWLTKNEILERYLNLVYFGEGTYGVEAASQFYFKHSARDITLAEAAMLVIQLNRPGGNSPINHPNRARILQREILNQMVGRGLATAEEADLSFKQYWDNYDFTRSNRSTAFLEREDAAPYFSEYVRGRLDELMLGSMDVYQDGLIVRTTLDLDYQLAAQQTLSRHLERVNEMRSNSAQRRRTVADTTFLPIVDLLSLTFDMGDVRVAGIRERNKGTDRFVRELAPALDVLGMMLDDRDLRALATAAYGLGEKDCAAHSGRGRVDYARCPLRSHPRHGRRQRVRHRQPVQPRHPGKGAAGVRLQAAVLLGGDQFGALYSRHHDNRCAGVVRERRWIPLHSTQLQGRVDRSSAVAHCSRPVDERAVSQGARGDRFRCRDRARQPDAGNRNAGRDRGDISPQVPARLGVIAVSPLQMARAYATFANNGQSVAPLAIQYVMDRNGRMVLEVEKELRARQGANHQERQIMTPQVAYVMTDLLQSTVQWGTLRWASGTVGGFQTDTAGKTGTTQNWSDAWTVGFTPRQATALWMGFDERGETLGLNLTGATATGPAWAEYMKAVEPGQPLRFVRPATGLIEVTVNARSGLLPAGAQGESIIQEIFLSGTDPKERDGLLAYEADRRGEIVDNLRLAMRRVDTGPPLGLVPAPLAPGDAAPPLAPGGAGTAAGRTPPRGANPLLD